MNGTVRTVAAAAVAAAYKNYLGLIHYRRTTDMIKNAANCDNEMTRQ